MEIEIGGYQVELSKDGISVHTQDGRWVGSASCLSNMTADIGADFYYELELELIELGLEELL